MNKVVHKYTADTEYVNNLDHLLLWLMEVTKFSIKTVLPFLTYKASREIICNCNPLKWACMVFWGEGVPFLGYSQIKGVE